tara:strand:+ start:251 stop:511 length:261 start_codon:yes stop_codon:yes gene_type:complete
VKTAHAAYILFIFIFVDTHVRIFLFLRQSMEVGDLVKYVGGNGGAYYGIVTEVDNRPIGPIRALLNGADYSMWFQRRNLELISASR